MLTPALLLFYTFLSAEFYCVFLSNDFLLLVLLP